MANDDKIRDSRQDYSKLINHQSLIKQIDEWERNSIEKIQHTAQECREELLKYMTNNIWNIEKKFNELKHIQRENQSNEMNFEYLKKRFDVMTKEFDCPSIISIREENSQDFIKKISIEFCVENKSNKWKENGKIIAGQNGQGEGLNQLNNPQGICIDKNKNIFIADTWNHRILQRKSNENQWKIIAGGNGQGDDTDQLDKPTDVIFDEQNNSLIIADTGNKRVIQLCLDQSQGMSRFIPWWNENQEEILIEDINCWGLAMDKFGFLYVSDFINNEVRKWKIGEEKGQLVAGGNGQGNQLNQLNSPTYIFVDNEQSIYISDNENNRIMKWFKDAKEGVIVAGGNGQGNNLNQLSSPEGLIVDRFGQIYIADCENYRISRWCEGKAEGEIILGKNGKGEKSDQFDSPMGLSLDVRGNLYIVDSGNHRIQRFAFICD